MNLQQHRMFGASLQGTIILGRWIVAWRNRSSAYTFNIRVCDDHDVVGQLWARAVLT